MSRSSSYILRSLAVALLLSLCLFTSTTQALDCDNITVSEDDMTWQAAPTPFVAQTAELGWTRLPNDDVCGGELIRIDTVGKHGATFPLYASTDVDDDEVVRVIFVFPGKLRDSWNYFKLMRNARAKAVTKYPDLNPRHIAIVAPAYLNRFDKDAGAANDDDYVWGGNSWSYGGHAKWPEDASPLHTSGFEVVDKIVDYIQDRWSNVERTMIAGHSLGAQAVNRYSTMTGRDDENVRYWVANPGSWLWMEHSRPNMTENEDCEGFDDYKFGLEGRSSRYVSRQNETMGGRKGLTKRLLSRPVHLLIGSDDNGLGDISCQAETQGNTHKLRGENYRDSIKSLNGGDLPDSYTYDEANKWSAEDSPGCTHNARCMFQSPPGMKSLFLEGYPGASDDGGEGERKAAKVSSSSSSSSATATKTTSSSSASKTSTSTSSQSSSSAKPTSTEESSSSSSSKESSSTRSSSSASSTSASSSSSSSEDKSTSTSSSSSSKSTSTGGSKRRVPVVRREMHA